MVKQKLLKYEAFTAILIIGIMLVSGFFGSIANINYVSISGQDDVSSQDTNDAEYSTQVVNTYTTRGTTRAVTDVGISSISDIDAINYIDHYPGKVAHMNVSIQNFGDEDLTTSFEVLLTISDGTSRPPSYHYQESRDVFSWFNITKMNANTTYNAYNMTWNWTPPLNMPDGCEKNFSNSDISFIACFTTLMDEDMNSNNNQMCIPIKVEQPDFDVRLEPYRLVNGIKYPTGDIYLTIISGQTNQFELNFTLYNFGEASFINFSVTAPPDWKAIAPPRQFWQSRSNSSYPLQNLSIMVFPSINRRYLPTATWLDISIKAVCESYPLAFDIETFRVKVRFLPYPNIVMPEIPEGQEVYFITPGDAYINFKVYNYGNGEDNFETKAQVGETGFEHKLKTKEGWWAVVHSGKQTRILKRNEYQVVTVKVHVPSTVRAGSPCGIKLTATSIKDPDHKDGEKNRTFYIFADLYKDVTVDYYNDRPISMYPGKEESSMLRIRNTGNKADKTIRMNVTSLPEDWEVLIDSSDIPPGGLPRNGTADIEVIIRTPKHVVESKYDIKIAAMSEDLVRDEITLTIQVLKVRKIALKASTARKSGNVSEKISYLITVENNGNSKDSVDLRSAYVSYGMKDMNWKVVLSKNFTTLYPYEERDVMVTVFIPLKALADTDFLTPTLDGYFIRIRGISQNDTSVISEVDIEVVVNPIYDFSFSKQEDRKYLIYRHTQNIDYTFSIENKGNDLDWYDIDYETDAAYDSWISIPYTQRKLQPGVKEELFVNFEIPETISAGEYEFIIKSSSAKVPSLKQELKLTIEIIEFDLALTEIRIGEETFSEAEVNEGETILLRAKLENVGDLDYYNKTLGKTAIIKFTESSNYIGEVNITYLPSQNNTEDNYYWVSLPWKIGKARDYEISAEIDPGEDIPESRRTNNKIKATLPVEKQRSSSGEGEDDSGASINMIITLIIIFIIVMVLGLLATYRISKKRTKKGYTESGEYKPYEESDDADFNKDEEEEEEEPEGGVLAVHDAHPYGGKKKDKFLTDVSSVVTMKPIRKTKPIKKSKPITAIVGEGKPEGLIRPKIAGYLPPKSETDDSTKPGPDN